MNTRYRCLRVFDLRAVEVRKVKYRARIAEHMAHRDSALDDLSVLNDPTWKPPSQNDIADWSRSAIKILSLADNLSVELNEQLAESQRLRSSLILKNSSLENEFLSMDRDLTQQLSGMPGTLQSYDQLRRKNRQKALAERQTRAMLIADGFMSADEAHDVLVDDAALVELGSQRLQELLSSSSSSSSLNGTSMETETRAATELNTDQSGMDNVEDGAVGRFTTNPCVNNTNVNNNDSSSPSSTKNKRRRRKRSKKKSGNSSTLRSKVASSSSSSSSSSSTRVSEPSIESNLDASARILAIMEAERKRDVFRQETLASLANKASHGKEHTAMVQLFAREKRQAEKMIAHMLSDYTPRPIPKHSPTKQQSSEKKARFKPAQLSPTSTQQRNGMVAQLRGSMGRGPQTNFTTANKMPGATLEVEPPPIPENMETDTVDLVYTRPRNEDGTPVESSVRDLIAEHTHEMDLTFPEIEKYRKPNSEYQKYLEPSR